MIQTKSIAPILFIVFSIFWLLLAINPLHRDIWIAENIILVVCFYYLISSYKRFKFSNISYILIFLFCILQTIGAHYTYAEVPLGFWVAELFDIQRNHFDRLVHFAFGFLIILPFKEVLIKTVKFTNRKTEIFVLIFLFLGIGAAYEILEWWYATIYEQGCADDMFLGSQGDVWDAEKDILLSGLGAYIFLLLFDIKTKNKTI